MTKLDDILEEFRRGTALDRIIAKYGDGGPLHRAYERYRPEMDQQIRDKRSQLSSLTGREDKLKVQVAGLETREKELKASIGSLGKEYESWKKETTKEKADLQQKSDGLKAALTKDGLELNRIDSALSDLKSKNVTIETITRIREMELQADENLLERVKTAADLKKVKTELSKLIEKKTKTHEEIAQQESTLKGLREESRTEKNTLDEWRARSVRTHICPECGLVMDRDLNAARNILERGLERAHAETGPLLVQNVRTSKFRRGGEKPTSFRSG